MELNWPLTDNLEPSYLRAAQIRQLQDCNYDVEEDKVSLPKDTSAILADVRMPAIRQCKLLRITSAVNVDSAFYPVEIPLSPKRWQWISGIEEEKDLTGMKPKLAELKLKEKGRRGLTLLEGLALYRVNPDILKKTTSLFLIGAHHYRLTTVIEEGKLKKVAIRMFPALSKDNWGHPELTTRPADTVCPDWVFFSVPRSY